ncbi:MAG: MbnP family protein [bacterium]
MSPNVLSLLKKLSGLLFAGFILLTGCKNDPDEGNPDPTTGRIAIQFKHLFDSVPLALDTLLFTDAFGNQIEINELQYFISDIRLHLHGGGAYQIATQDGIHYVDARIPESHQWFPVDGIPATQYDSVSFTFGLNAIKNYSNRFPDPPERDMFWPEVLGGGYHYMKLNTRWKNDTIPELRPFMMHLGIGQIYDPVKPDSIIGFAQNYFFVKLLNSSFGIQPGKTKTLVLTMQIDKWFDGPPNALNLASMPAGIMQNQPLMHAVCLNGRNAFWVKTE